MEQPSVPKEAPVRLGQRLRRARLARNLTQSEVAQKQFSVSYISAVERGQIRPSLGALEKLSERLQIPLAELMREDDGASLTLAPTTDRPETTAERSAITSKLREAQILARQGRAGDALKVLDALGRQTRSLRDQALIHWQRAFALDQTGHSEEARHEVQEALVLAERLGDPELRERLRAELGRVYSQLHRYQLALEQYLDCLGAIERGVLRDPAFALMVLHALGDVSWRLGENSAALGYLARAATLSDDVLNPALLGATYWMLSTGYAADGDVVRAEYYADRSLAALEQAGIGQIVSQVYNRLGRAYGQSGQLQDALVHLEKAHQMAEQQQDARGLAEAQQSLSTVYLRQGDIERAAESAHQAIELSKAVGDEVVEAESLLAQAQVCEATNEYPSAAHDFERAIELLSEAQATQQLGDAYALYSAYLERRGEGQRALELLKLAWQVRERGLVQ